MLRLSLEYLFPYFSPNKKVQSDCSDFNGLSYGHHGRVLEVLE